MESARLPSKVHLARRSDEKVQFALGHRELQEMGVMIVARNARGEESCDRTRIRSLTCRRGLRGGSGSCQRKSMSAENVGESAID